MGELRPPPKRLNKTALIFYYMPKGKKTIRRKTRKGSKLSSAESKEVQRIMADEGLPLDVAIRTVKGRAARLREEKPY